MAKLNISVSNITIFIGKVTELRLSLETIRKKARIYDLSDADMIGLAYDYPEGKGQPPSGVQTIWGATLVLRRETWNRK